MVVRGGSVALRHNLRALIFTLIPLLCEMPLQSAQCLSTSRLPERFLRKSFPMGTVVPSDVT